MRLLRRHHPGALCTVDCAGRLPAHRAGSFRSARLVPGAASCAAVGMECLRKLTHKNNCIISNAAQHHSLLPAPTSCAFAKPSSSVLLGAFSPLKKGPLASWCCMESSSTCLLCLLPAGAVPLAAGGRHGAVRAGPALPPAALPLHSLLQRQRDRGARDAPALDELPL